MAGRDVCVERGRIGARHAPYGESDRLAVARERARAHPHGASPTATPTTRCWSSPGRCPAADWAVLWSERGWPSLFVCVTAIAFVFPDGRLPSPRWRRIATVAVASFLSLIVVSLLGAERYSEEFQDVSSPLPTLPESVISIPFVISGLGALSALVAAALAVRTRMKRSAGVERLQMKWLAYAASFVPAAVVVSVLENLVTGKEGRATDIADGARPDGDTGCHRDRGDALPPLRDRPADQPHAGLRHAVRRRWRRSSRSFRCRWGW